MNRPPKTSRNELHTLASGAPASPSGPYRLEGLELACGTVLGADVTTPPLAKEPSATTPRAALESILLEALKHPPCVVSFSGGRDSSGLLALAAKLARTNGLAPPVPATNVFPSIAESDESSWQELVINHTRTDNWQRLVFTDELDIIGPLAAPALLKWGPCYPFNAHFILPALALARGGCFITGVGGDQIFQLSDRNHLGAIVTGRERLRRRHLSPALAALLPLTLRRRYYTRKAPRIPWLTRRASAEFGYMIGRAFATQHIWNAPDLLDHFWRDLRRVAVESTLGAYGASCNALVVHPFQHPDFLRAVAGSRPRVGWLTRDDAMQELFGDLLPDAVQRRRSKALFSDAFFGSYSRRFVEHWSGEGLDSSLVNTEALLETWKAPVVAANSYSLLQGAWLAATCATTPTEAA